MSFKGAFLAIAFTLAATAPALAIESVNTTIFTSSPVTVQAGQDFLIAIGSNPTTGYSWTAKSSSPAVAVEGSAYQSHLNATSSNGKPMLLGAAGQQIFVLEAMKPGTATVTFSYARPWQKGVKPARTMTFSVTVK